MKKLKLFFACLLMAVLSIGQVWAAEDEVHKFNSSNETREVGLNNNAAIPAIEIAAPAYPVKKVAVNCKYNKAGLPGVTISVTVGGNAFGEAYTFNEKTTKTVNFEGSAASGDIVISFVNNSGTGTGKGTFYVYYVELTEGASGGTPTCAAPTFSPNGATFYGESQSVELTCATSGATIHYTLDGSTPTSSSATYSEALSLTSTTTVKAIAVKEGSNDSEIASATFTKGEAVTSYAINFETNNLDAYVNWDFVNIGIKSATITAHGGTYYGANVNGSGNGVATASITTKAKYATPGTLTFYVSKESNNTTASSWKAQVSEDGEAWTDVETFDAKVMDKGVWNECTADLSSYSNVYVRIAYDGSTAIRTIDDIELAAASDIAKPSISGTDNFLASSEISMTCLTAGAEIYYTLDGSDPKSGTKYTAAFSIEETKTIKAIAKLGSNWSQVAEATFTKATVMTVAQALAATPAANKYVAGIVASVTEVSTEHGNATYTLKDAGEENSIIIYRGKYLNNVAFTSVDQIEEGDEVTVFGEIKVHNEVNQFTTGNYIVAMFPKARLAWSGTTAGVFEASLEGGNAFPTLINSNSVTVEYSSSNTDAATINASTGEISLVGVGSTTITASFAGNSSFKANSVSYTLNVSSSVIKADISFECNGATSCPETMLAQSNLPSPLPTITKAGKNFGGWWTTSTFEEGTEAVAGAAVESTDDITLYAKWLDPYNITAAKAVIDATPAGTANQYVAGKISQIDSYNSTYHSITYWISDDGTTTNQLQVYSGLIGNAATALGKDDFSAKEDLELGDEVVVTGTLKLHNSSVYEFDKNNTIYTFSRKASAGLEYAVTAVNKVVGDADFVNELTNPNSVAVTYATSDDQVAEVANDGTVTIIGEGTATISATFAGNETYKAAVVSYTLTVSATVDTRHIANSPATFTTTNGNLDPADIAYASYQGGSSTAPAIYNDGIRLYQIGGSNDFGGFVTITAKTGCTIDEVQITTTSKYATTVAYSKDGNETLSGSESVAKSGSYTTGTGLNVSSVNILNLGTGSDGRLEIASIKVYYTGEAATIDHYELGGTYQTAFMQNEDFNHTGLIVYAAYDALGENKVDITSMCTFSEPDMSTTGDKTIEITYNEAVVISYTINVAADSRKVADSPATFTTVSGDMTPNDITFASYQGGAGTAPQNYNDGIRLYQAPSADAIGGFITLKAKKGCTIDQVKITTTNTYATTVAYSVDGNENLLGSESVAKSSDYSTPSGLNVESVNIVNKGTGSNGRLEIASIKVWYTGDALPVHHYILGGTYETVFEQFGTFSYEGLTVTAAYDELETITEAVTGFTVEADLSTAGAKKAEVYLGLVKIAEYDITVNASAKQDPALAYTPSTQTIAAADVASWSAPAFSNELNVSPITFVSDKPAVATVDDNGVIALAGGYGTAVITATFVEDDDYIGSVATYTITVNEPAEDLSGTWVVATSVAAGDRIIIGATYQDATKTMGAQNTNNRAAVTSTLADGVLTPSEGTKTFLVVDAGDGKFALQALNGKYLTASGTGTKNYLTETADYEADNAKWTISFDGNEANVVASSSNRNTMRYNSGDELFSCYAAGGQRAINIYKKGTPDYGSYQRDVTNGNYGTICLPKAGTISGATLFEIGSFENEMIYVDEVIGGVMEAGKPYIFQATADQLNVTYTSGEQVAASSANGLHGFYDLENMATDEAAQKNLDQDDGNYILYQNQYWLVSGRAAFIYNFRAYIKLDDITPKAAAPGRRRVAMPVNGANAPQGFENLQSGDAPVKVMIDGTLYIFRGEKQYDATGRLVK